MTYRSLAQTYADQLDEIGQMMVRLGLLTKSEIRRHGVRFALRERFEPKGMGLVSSLEVVRQRVEKKEREIIRLQRRRVRRYKAKL
jgi:hypothetical protein